MPKLILASQSPRRKQLLSTLIKDFDIRVPNTPEHFDPSLSIDAALIQVAQAKAHQIDLGLDEVVLAADTIVVYRQRILGKPKDAQEALAMLRQLSGQTHVVKTAIVLCSLIQEVAYIEHTQVVFKRLNEDVLLNYVQSGSPLDKAGAYGIQDKVDFVETLEGEYENVMGLPLKRLKHELKHFGF